jgi:hypothetical protein
MDTELEAPWAGAPLVFSGLAHLWLSASLWLAWAVPGSTPTTRGVGFQSRAPEVAGVQPHVRGADVAGALYSRWLAGPVHPGDTSCYMDIASAQPTEQQLEDLNPKLALGTQLQTSRASHLLAGRDMLLTSDIRWVPGP